MARDAIGEDSYADFKKSDIGDIFGLEGFAFRTKTGEFLSMQRRNHSFSKSLQILPEKFHGLTDTDTRYRQRYVDLIMNQESKNVFIKRSRYSRKSVTSLQAVISWKLRLRCLFQTQVVLQQDHLRLITMH